MNERRIREEDTNTASAWAREGGWDRASWTAETKAREKREGDKFRVIEGGGRERGIESGPNVAVTGDVALPDDISPRNYLSVQRDSAKRLLVLMPTDNIPIVSQCLAPGDLSNRQLECTVPIVHT